jgi:hypothetical protein
MDNNRRRITRRQVNLVCKVTSPDGLDVRSGMVTDISELGARLAVRSPQTMPDEFNLSFTPTGYPFRRCRLIWRGNDHVGVEFHEHGRGRYEFPQISERADRGSISPDALPNPR